VFERKNKFRRKKRRMTSEEISREIQEAIEKYGINYCKQCPEDTFVVPLMTFERMDPREFRKLFEGVSKINNNWRLYYEEVMRSLEYMNPAWLEEAQLP
jgi:hypothetical protein